MSRSSFEGEDACEAFFHRVKLTTVEAGTWKGGEAMRTGKPLVWGEGGVANVAFAREEDVEEIGKHW